MKYKSFIIAATVVVLLSSGALAQRSVNFPTDEVTGKSFWWSGGPFDPALDWAQDIDRKIMGNPPGDVYYVDGNRSVDTGDGKSWATAFQMLSTALAASHADIAVSADRQWASRNRIYVMGDTITEDLVLMAQKTDIVGVGNNNPYNMPGIVGNHVIPSTTATPSCRWYNIQFYGDTAGKVFDVDNQGGLEFHGCLFQSNGNATIGIEASECTRLVINECTFLSIDGVDFSTAAISFANDTTAIANTHVTNNRIRSDGIGINIDETVATGFYITGNHIVSGGMCIDDEGDDAWVVNNNMQCLTYGKAAFDFNMARAQNNILTTPVRTTPIPYTNECAGAVAAAKRGSFGTIYYVDRNMAATGGDGLTWETACQSLTTAMAKSHANIGVSAQRGWAQRNTIYMRGDVMTEDHIVLAQKTDIVGVGSSNYNSRPYMIGTWVIPNTDSWMGCHFYNMYFKDDGAGGILFQVALQGGLQFHNCTFEAAATDTIGLQLTNCDYDTIIDNCDFVRAAGASFSTAAIKIVDGSSTFTTGITIKNSRIYSDGIGIDWDETTDVFDCWITDNYFRTAGMCVDAEDTVGLNVIGNRMITLVNAADNTSNDFHVEYAMDNIVTGGDPTTIYIPSPADF